MHRETVRGEFCDRADHDGPSHPRHCSVCVDDILPPAGNPNFFSFAALEKRTSWIPPANHRSSFDGSLGLFCVGPDCTRNVSHKRARNLRPTETVQFCQMSSFIARKLDMAPEGNSGLPPTRPLSL